MCVTVYVEVHLVRCRLRHRRHAIIPHTPVKNILPPFHTWPHDAQEIHFGPLRIGLVSANGGMWAQACRFCQNGECSSVVHFSCMQKRIVLAFALAPRFCSRTRCCCLGTSDFPLESVITQNIYCSVAYEKYTQHTCWWYFVLTFGMPPVKVTLLAVPFAGSAYDSRTATGWIAHVS